MMRVDSDSMQSRFGIFVVRPSAKLGSRLMATGIGCAMLLGSVQAALSVNCKPGHFRAPYFIKSMGACAFDAQTLSFAGTPVEQAMCLMRGMDATRNLAAPLEKLPAALASRVGQTTGLPSRQALSSLLSKEGLEWTFAAYLWQPVSRARDDDPDAPMARYFVIHDTSGPNFGHRSLPDDINSSAGFNNLANFACSDGWGRAHIFINRAGQMLVAHDYSIAWRETKFEQAAEFGGALQGLFLHNELVQPRRSAPGHGRSNDARSPDPAFTAAQYDRLALLYVIASVRADRWLIPAFHAALDADIPNGHDDPLNFDIEGFAKSLDELVAKLQHPEQIAAATGAPAVELQADELTEPLDPASIEERATPTQAVSPPAVPSTEPTAAALIASKDDQASKVALLDAIVPPQKNESHSEQKSASAELCETRRIKGHSRRLCEPVRAERHERARRDQTHTVRLADRDNSNESRGSHERLGARHHGSDLHTRHARGSSRHNGA